MLELLQLVEGLSQASLWACVGVELMDVGCLTQALTQGNRLSCRGQEGRRGSEEAVPARPAPGPPSEPEVWGTFSPR